MPSTAKQILRTGYKTFHFRNLKEIWNVVHGSLTGDIFLICLKHQFPQNGHTCFISVQIKNLKHILSKQSPLLYGLVLKIMLNP